MIIKTMILDYMHCRDRLDTTKFVRPVFGGPDHLFPVLFILDNSAVLL